MNDKTEIMVIILNIAALAAEAVAVYFFIKALIIGIRLMEAYL